MHVITLRLIAAQAAAIPNLRMEYTTLDFQGLVRRQIELDRSSGTLEQVSNAYYAQVGSSVEPETRAEQLDRLVRLAAIAQRTAEDTELLPWPRSPKQLETKA